MASRDNTEAPRVAAAVAPRVPEREDALQGSLYVDAFDELQATLYRQGWLETEAVLRSGIDAGSVLEVGPGPGYLGLEWLERTRDTHLTGLDSCADMIRLAQRNAVQQGLAARVSYVLGSGEAPPFEDGAFDAVFSVRSLHEWLDPTTTFAEIWRVLKPGGRAFVSDLRRDLPSTARLFLGRRMPSEQAHSGFLASLDAAYTLDEVQTLLENAGGHGWTVTCTPMGLKIAGVKPA